MASSSHPRRIRNRRSLPPLVLSTEQVDRIITVANADPRLHITRDVIQILSETGLRSGELCGLRISSLDIANNRLFIPRGKTKGRFVPVTPRALNALQSLHAQFPTSDFVMGDKAHRVLRRVALSFRKIVAQIGAAGHTLHSLRHHFAMRLASGGVNPMTLARWMGHSCPLRSVRYCPGRNRGGA